MFIDHLENENAPWLSRVIETNYTHADGSLRPVETRMFPIRTMGGLRLGTFTRDVLQRKQAQDDLHRLNRELEQRIEERTAALEAKNRELQTFAYTVSHSLKAPLRGIEGYSRLLLQSYAGRLDEEGQSFLDNIRSGEARMLELIDGLLSYTRVEHRQATFVQVELVEFVARVVASCAAGMSGRGVEYVLKIACGTVTIDAQGLELILRNLIDNAVKFSQHTAASSA